MTNPLSADLDHILEHTRELWEELRGERIFITGGTGFFGCWLLESLLWANDRLNLDCRATVLSRSPDLFRAKAPYLAGHKIISILQGDIRTFDFPNGKFSHVIHAAMETNVNLQNPSALTYFDSAVLGTRHVMDFARSAGTQQVLFTSSGAVYGRQPPEITTIGEEYRGAPYPSEIKLAYGQSKRAAEFLCTAYSELYNIKVKICRCFAFSGPYLPLDSGFAIGNFLRDVLYGNSIYVNGDGTPYRSYLYAADLAIWLWTIFFRGDSTRAYNVGSENALSIAQLAETVRNVVLPESAIVISKQPDPGRVPERYVPSIQRAHDELGLSEWIGLEEGIKRMAKWHLEK
ncbi:MAG TPA: NAD(P)-dependent oxidoreductase [Anaerolineales bacterium]|nr:NAD(P)-dependent oxidoreductase [Anaerolineales bacterium]